MTGPAAPTPRSRDDAEEGAVGAITGLFMVVLMGTAALAVDAGLLQHQRRSLQAAVDAAALSAVRNTATAVPRVQAVMTGQNFAGAATTVTLGAYVDDPALTPAARFTPAGAPLDAVRVRATATAPLGFARVLLPQTMASISATATAAHRPAAGFTIGSGLASVDNGIANQMLSRLLGGSVNLTAAAYTGLLTSNVGMVRLLDTMATAQVGTYRQLLGSRVGVGQSLSAAAGVLAPGASQTAGTSLNLLSQAGGGKSLTVGSLVNLGIHQARPVGALVADQSYAAASLNALDLVQTAAALGGPTSAFDLPNDITIPGLATVRARLLMIQPPQPSSLGMAGTTTASTAQLRLLLSVKLLSLIGTGVIQVPVLVEAAQATGTVTSVTCAGVPLADTRMTVRATTGVARARIGTVSQADFDNPAALGTLAAAPIVTLAGLPVVTALADARLGAATADLTWVAAEIGNHTLRSVSAGGLAGSLVGSLVSSATLAPLGVAGAAINLAALRGLLAPVFSALDPIIDQILGAAGVRLGFAEIRPIGARCGVPSLVL